MENWTKEEEEIIIQIVFTEHSLWAKDSVYYHDALRKFKVSSSLLWSESKHWLLLPELLNPRQGVEYKVAL